MSELIEVSIICNTYNHEKYIRKALDGFVMQKTNFKYEILVHDDASTDLTAKIIAEYETKYPGLVKPIYQKNNQYSKGISISMNYQFPRVKGKYIAFCEGDDYWTDKNKLQKQYDILEENVDIDMCAHSVSTEENGEIIRIISPLNKNGILSVENVILNGGGYLGSCSLMYRSSINSNIPQFRLNCMLDYSLQISGALRGGVYFLNDNMSTYRIGTQGSWTERIYRNKEKVVVHNNKMINMLKELNVYTNEKYNKIIQFVINEFNFRNAVANNEDKQIAEFAKKLAWHRNLEVYCYYSKREFFKQFVKYYFPKIFLKYFG